jgi:hypothetical protein
MLDPAFEPDAFIGMFYIPSFAAERVAAANTAPSCFTACEIAISS